MHIIGGLFLFSLGLWIIRRSNQPRDDGGDLKKQFREVQVKCNRLESLYQADKLRLESLIITAELNSTLLQSALLREETAKDYIRSILAKYGADDEEIEAAIQGIYE
jgi:hypothetical protein